MAPLHALGDEKSCLVVGGEHPDGALLQHDVEISQPGFGKLVVFKAQGAFSVLCFGATCLPDSAPQAGVREQNQQITTIHARFITYSLVLSVSGALWVI